MNKTLTAADRATIMDACQSISRSADALKAGCSIDGEWPDADDKAFYDAELRLLERLTALLTAQQRETPTFEAKHISLKQKGAKLILTLELDGVESAPRYMVMPINPSVVRPKPEPRAEVAEEQPSLTNPLTPYGMLVRALRIAAKTTLNDMAKHMQCGPAALSAVEFGRKPLTDAMVADTAAYFSSVGIPGTLHALNTAIPGQPVSDCWCETCRPVWSGNPQDMRMVLCPDCGNKRCPRATSHENACTGSNEVGQKGSSWEHVKPVGSKT